jgi:hypothetical protein
MGCNNRLRLRSLDRLHLIIVGATMTWVVEHIDGLTQFALIAIPTTIVFCLTIAAAMSTPEASELDGFPIASDYPPLSEENIVELRERKMKSHPSKGQL